MHIYTFYTQKHMKATITSYLQNHTLPPLCCVAIAYQHLLTQNDKVLVRILKLWLEQSPFLPVKEALATYNKIKEYAEEGVLPWNKKCSSTGAHKVGRCMVNHEM